MDAIGKGATSLVDQLTQFDGQLADASKRVEEARRDLLTLDLGVIDAAELHQALEEFEPLWAELVPKERSRVFALLLEHVEFDAESGEVAITFRPQSPSPTRCGS